MILRKVFLFRFAFLFLTIIIDVTYLDGQELSEANNHKIDYLLYAGVNCNFIKGSGVYTKDESIKDSTYPFSDSIKFQPSLSVHSGGAISYNITNNIKCGIGLELNCRKKHIRLFGDSTSNSGLPLPEYNRVKSLFNNIEIPLFLSIGVKKFEIGGGVRFTATEFRVKKFYKDTELLSRDMSSALFYKSFSDKIIFPNIYIDYLVFSGLDFALRLKGSYEFGDKLNSTVYLSILFQK